MKITLHKKHFGIHYQLIKKLFRNYLRLWNSKKDKETVAFLTLLCTIIDTTTGLFTREIILHNGGPSGSLLRNEWPTLSKILGLFHFPYLKPGNINIIGNNLAIET